MFSRHPLRLVLLRIRIRMSFRHQSRERTSTPMDVYTKADRVWLALVCDSSPCICKRRWNFYRNFRVCSLLLTFVKYDSVVSSESNCLFQHFILFQIEFLSRESILFKFVCWYFTFMKHNRFWKIHEIFKLFDHIKKTVLQLENFKLFGYFGKSEVIKLIVSWLLKACFYI
jgi:hypothetical protein